MAVAEEVTVFAETNLGTRIVMTVPLDITAADFKRKLEKTHASCFSNLGEIQVHGLMVKRKSRFYYLVESVPIKYIFGDNQKPWFIHAEARVVSRSQEPSISNSIDKTHIRHCSGSDNSIEGVTALIQGEKKKIKKSRAKPDSRNIASGQQTCLDKREYLGPSTSEPETIRSSSSIARVAEMKNSECLKSFTPKPPGRNPVDPISEMICKKVTVAANNIRMQGKTHISSSLSSSIVRSNSCRNRSLDGKIITSLAKFMVFEVPDYED
ncbi:hypothetical protein ISN45_Aa01g040140 [Arabidopsis thaliana x Arabidopsis arenosa]|uniref:Uncharacterized protein n=1 Tax=Arabidopsis thaliana x Arabidopsis arenosa TaxID=1240361 RepID=A0A8T2C886_9BRAS|nr:hypothetical protein ISN45_Aa01g040140 [Arabidopsis thaliana x Arabidopsis arenosa]